MPGRRPLYQSESERPITLCVRVPRDLYEQVQRQVGTRRMTLTEASLDALRLWVETSADPRDLVASNYSNTIALQQLEERVGTRLDALEAALATLRLEASASTSDRQPSPDNIQYDSSITSVIQKSEAALTADGTAKREGYGALAGQVQAYATQHQGGFTCAEAAKALDATSKQVNQVLKRLVKQGLVGTEGSQRQAVYWWRGA